MQRTMPVPLRIVIAILIVAAVIGLALFIVGGRTHGTTRNEHTGSTSPTTADLGKVAKHVVTNGPPGLTPLDPKDYPESPVDTHTGP